MSKLLLKIEREVKPTEVLSLIWGTGGLTWEWWGGAAQYRGEERVDFDPDLNNAEAGDHFVIEHADMHEPEGAPMITTKVTMQEIVDAASAAMAAGLIGAESLNDMANEDLGYADAGEADVVLQLAVFKEVVFG